MRRGACPTLGRPMRTGDGLLARLRPEDCRLTLAQLRAVARGAETFGNGILEVTARGSLQIRGLAQERVRPLEQAVFEADIKPASGLMVEVPPLAGIDPEELVDPRPIAEDIRRRVAHHVPLLVLAPKLAVTVDGGGRFHLGAVTADVRLTAIDDNRFLLAVGGTNGSARKIAVVSAEEAASAVVQVLEAIAAIGPAARGRDAMPDMLGGLYDPAASEVSVASDVPSFLGVQRLGLPPSVLPDISPSRGEIRWSANSPPSFVERPASYGHLGQPESHWRISPLEGEMPGRAEGGKRQPPSETYSLGLAFPYRQARSAGLIAFLDDIEILGLSDIRLSPGHGLILTGLHHAEALEAEDAARRHGFWTSQAEPRANISLCAGSSGCASAHFDTHEVAEELASHAPILLDGSLTLHLSGCPKGCAHPAPAPLTLTGAPSGYGLVVNGAASDAPAVYIAAKDLGIAFARLASCVADAKETDETARDCLARLGPAAIAAALTLDRQ
ncbi:precorrin-3B synthase [Rhizobium sp.]